MRLGTAVSRSLHGAITLVFLTAIAEVLLVGPKLAPHAIPALSAAVVAALLVLGARLLAA